MKALACFSKKYPQVNVEILEGSTKDVNRMVLEHEAEFGISIVPADGFQKETLIEDHIVAISRDKLMEEEIHLLQSNEQFLICRAAMESLQSILGTSIAYAKNFKVVGRSTVRLMAQEGLGIGIQSALLVDPFKEHFYVYPVKPEIRTDLVLIANDFDDLSPAANAFVEIVRQQ